MPRRKRLPRIPSSAELEDRLRRSLKRLDRQFRKLGFGSKTRPIDHEGLMRLMERTTEKIKRSIKNCRFCRMAKMQRE